MNSNQLISDRESRYNVIDFIKALGSVVILVFHYGHLFEYSRLPNIAGGVAEAFKSIFLYGQTAVELFFLLSGFVISAASTRKSYCENITLSSFVFSKLKRLYPCFLITTIACLCIQGMSVLKTGSMVLGQANYHLFDILCNFLMIQTGVFLPEVCSMFHYGF